MPILTVTILSALGISYPLLNFVPSYRLEKLKEALQEIKLLSATSTTTIEATEIFESETESSLPIYVNVDDKLSVPIGNSKETSTFPSSPAVSILYANSCKFDAASPIQFQMLNYRLIEQEENPTAAAFDHRSTKFVYNVEELQFALSRAQGAAQLVDGRCWKFPLKISHITFPRGVYIHESTKTISSHQQTLAAFVVRKTKRLPFSVAVPLISMCGFCIYVANL